MTTRYNNNGLRTRVILDFVDQNVGWGTLHDILHEQQVLRTHTYAREHCALCSTTTRHKNTK